MSKLITPLTPTKAQGLTELNKSLRAMLLQLSPLEVKYVVKSYYDLQEFRMTANKKTKTVRKNMKETRMLPPEIEEELEEVDLENDADPVSPVEAALMGWLGSNFEYLEEQIESVLGSWAKKYELGRWLQGLWGIGNVLSAGLLAVNDWGKIRTAGQVWSFFGYNPARIWPSKDQAEKIWENEMRNEGKVAQYNNLHRMAKEIGTNADRLLQYIASNGHKGLTKENVLAALCRCPYSQNAKLLGYKIGECLIKVQNKDTPNYGRFFARRKGDEWDKNLGGFFSDQAWAIHKSRARMDEYFRNWYSGKYSRKDVIAIGIDDSLELKKKLEPSSDGIPMLPPSHITARARRKAVKLFLSHVHLVGYWIANKELPPVPFALEHMGHKEMILPIDHEDVEGLTDALRKQYPGAFIK